MTSSTIDPGRVSITANRGDAGRRLDLVLCDRLAADLHGSRTRLQNWIRNGRVSINGSAVTRTAARVAFGDVIEVVRAVPPRHAAAAENIAIDVLYEDDHLIAVDKPAGVAVHPAYKNTTGTLLNALLWRARGWPAPQRPSIAGRLDKLTSGVVLAAKTASAHAALQRAMAAKDARKQYLAVVYGRVNASWGEIRLPLSRDRADRRKMSVSRTGGAPSATGFERLAIAAAPRSGLSLLQCTLLTGRMHQIRAHLAFCGWPIVGDPVYGEPRWPAVTDQEVAEALRAFPRQALHAWRLSLTHPATGARLIVQAPVPPDLLRLLQVTGLSLPPPSIDLPTHH